MDELGVYSSLAPLSERKESFSLSGSPSLLVAVGGYKGGRVTKKCEQYVTRRNSWRGLPSLNKERRGCGTCLSKNERVLCFGGAEWHEQSEIECLQIGSQGEWKRLGVS